MAARLALRELGTTAGDDGAAGRAAELEREIGRVLRREHDRIYGGLAPHTPPRARGAAAAVKPTWRGGYLVRLELRARPALELSNAYAFIDEIAAGRDLRELALRGEGPLPARVDHGALGALEIGGACVSPAVLALLASSLLPRLTRLSLSGWLGQSKVPSQIARMPLLPQLRELSLTACGFEDHDLAGFALRADAFAHLDALDLRGHRFSRRAVREAREALGDALLTGA
ncbi:MAG: hypothetical protein KC657_35600 [Myxococcales bacterium]|nr:hypothetical protein [Myxococcales bacterium]